MNKKVIYSAVIGDYDTIKQPQVINPEFDYILFSNSINDDRIGIWHIKGIDYHNPDNTRIARYVKTHPIELLPEYDVSVWIDSNISICSDYIYRRVEELIERDIAISSIQHWRDSCIYNEAFEIIKIGYDKESIVIKQMNYLVKNGYQKNQGLCETNILYRIHTPEVDTFNKEWWRMIDKYSKRDQLSFNYVLWKTKLSFEYLLPEGKTARNVSDFEITSHLRNTNKRKYKTWIMQHYHKREYALKMTKNVYWWIYNRRLPIFWSFIIGLPLRAAYLIERISRKIINKITISTKETH